VCARETSSSSKLIWECLQQKQMSFLTILICKLEARHQRWPAAVELDRSGSVVGTPNSFGRLGRSPVLVSVALMVILVVWNGMGPVMPFSACASIQESFSRGR